MMTPGEQVRQDAPRKELREAAEAMVAIHGDNARLAHGCLALLAELEQAEQREAALVEAGICRRFTMTWCRDRPELPESEWCKWCAALAAHEQAGT